MQTTIFASLGDPSRFRIVTLLGKKDKTVDELKKELAISQSSTSQHLKILHEAGLVSFKKHGNFRIYTLRREKLKKAMSYFDKLWDTSLEKLKSNLEN